MEKQTFGDHSDRCRTLVLQSNEAPIGVVGMVQKARFSKVQVVAIFQKGRREERIFVLGIDFFVQNQMDRFLASTHYGGDIWCAFQIFRELLD